MDCYPRQGGASFYLNLSTFLPDRPVLQVYDISAFLAEHPGGAAILEENSGARTETLPLLNSIESLHILILILSGLDSSEQFEDAGHSLDAREMLSDYYIGDLAEEDRKLAEGSQGVTRNQVLLATAVLLVASLIFVRYSLPKTP